MAPPLYRPRVFPAREDRHPLPPEPTDTQPGSPARVAGYAARAAAGQRLFHPASPGRVARGE